jgi:hypothetical protein
MYQANLSFHQLESYLGQILRNELVAKRYVEEETLYFATEKGLRFLSAVEKIKDLLVQSSLKKEEKGITSVITRSEIPAEMRGVEEFAF